MTAEAITGWAMFAGVAIGWVIREYRQHKNNRNHLNNSINEDKVRRFIAEHERDCKNVAELRSDLSEIRQEDLKQIREAIASGFLALTMRIDKLWDKR